MTFEVQTLQFPKGIVWERFLCPDTGMLHCVTVSKAQKVLFS